jgi:thioredoxin-like negative regulator of GroEL
LSPQCPPEYRPKSDTEFQRLFKEANFAALQAFVFCPHSTEAVFRYANVLLQSNRLDDALLVALTCLKLDPYSEQVVNLVKTLQGFKKQQAEAEQVSHTLPDLENAARQNPTNFQTALKLARAYVQLQQMDHAAQVLDGVLNAPGVDPASVVSVAQTYVQMANWPKLELTLEKLVKMTPENPEAWYDLATLKCALSKPVEALSTLSRALALNNQRLQRDPKAPDLLAKARTDTRLDPLRPSPEFRKLVP